MSTLFLLMALGQMPPATPSPVYPSSEGAVRDEGQRVSLSAPPSGVTRAVFEFRRRDGGTYDCMTPGACPVHTTALFDEVSTDTLPDDFWCFRGRYENDAGTSGFSTERCYLDDKTPPPQPLSDAGLVNGVAVIEYDAPEDVGPAPSLVIFFCASAVEENTGDRFDPYCSSGSWGRARPADAGGFFSNRLRLPLPPGVWKVGVEARDAAGNASLKGPQRDQRRGVSVAKTSRSGRTVTIATGFTSLTPASISTSKRFTSCASNTTVSTSEKVLPMQTR